MGPKEVLSFLNLKWDVRHDWCYFARAGGWIVSAKVSV